MSNTTLWYAARGTGFVAVIMLSASVVLGIVTSLRWSTRSWPRFVTSTLHKNISLLSVLFLAAHITTTVIDPASPVHLLNAIIPFTGSYRPLGIGMGVVAVDLLAAVVVSSVLKKHISHRTWRAIHWGAYACWPIAMLHGLDSGSDAATAWALFVYGTCAALVTTAIAWGFTAALLEPTPTPRAARSPRTMHLG